MQVYGQTSAAGSAREGRDVPGELSTGPSDAALIDRMRGGDEGALATLYDRWSDRVYSLAAHLLRDKRDAEDIVEETFWQAWRGAAQFDADRGSVGTWLLTICRSRALDRLRARRRKPEDVALDDAPPIEDPHGDPMAAMVTNETGRIVRAALAELPAEQRQALEMAYFRGLSQSEISEATGQPLGTIKTRVRLAMVKLREKLGALRETSP
jgi:RNA polymerase sigma-70 factor (ECF subfamily)